MRNQSKKGKDVYSEEIKEEIYNAPKKERSRKPRKQNEKEILSTLIQEAYIPNSEEPSSLITVVNDNIFESKMDLSFKQPYLNPYKYTKKNMENFAHLSAKERAIFEKKFTIPKNTHQEHYYNVLKTKKNKIVIANGPAGTGKTLFATEFGIRFFLTETYEKLIFTRPSVSVDEDLGFLPGTLEEKMAPWIRPIYDILYQYLTPKEVTQLIEEKIIEIAPLGYMRGRTFKNAWIVADEMQNSTISQMKMLMTRLGENSRLIITGDLEQFDRSFEYNGLDDFLKKFRGRSSESIVSFDFEKSDIQREEVVKEVLDIYDGI